MNGARRWLRPMIPFHSWRNRFALLSVCLSSLMFGLEISSIPTILPILEKVLHSDFQQMQWIMNAYTIACTTVLMAVGTLADRYGRRRVFLISVVGFGLASLGCGLAKDATLLIAARFLQGIGGGAMLICQVAILSHQFPEKQERGRAFAVWGVIFGIGLGFGPIIGSGILAVMRWPWVFLVHVPLSGLTWALAVKGVRESRDPQAQRLDGAGIVTLSLAVFGFTWYITQAPAQGFGSPAALGVLAGAILSLIAFYFVEVRQAHPMFDFSVFRRPAFSGAILGSVGMNFSFWPLMIYLPIFFQICLGYGVMKAGWCLLAYTLPTLLVPPVAERWVIRYQPGVVIPWGLFAIGLGLLLMWVGSDPAYASGWTMVPGSLIAGIGLGFSNTPVTNTTTASVPSARAGMASGMDMSARLISLAMNIAIMGFLLIEGTLASLRGSFAGAQPDLTQMRAWAGHIAAGSTAEALTAAVPMASTLDPSGTISRTALAHGFGWVLLYGGICVWLLAGTSFAVFRAGKTTVKKEE